MQPVPMPTVGLRGEQDGARRFGPSTGVRWGLPHIRPDIKIPVLTYHSAQVDGDEYKTNDHVALHEDLRVLHREGFRIVPLSWIVDWVRGERPDRDLECALALTFDDGCSLDVWDLEHPECGPQTSFLRILEDFRAQVGDAQPHLHATSFVIASAEARAEIGALYASSEWLTDEWWREADALAHFAVENHSWDHNHPVVSRVCQRRGVAGRFDNIDTYDECDAEVRRAGALIAEKTGRHPESFAYPWGQMSRYIRDEYFPRYVREHQCRAAWSAHDGFVTRQSSVWALPRVVFRANWTDRDGFRRLLDEARA